MACVEYDDDLFGWHPLDDVDYLVVPDAAYLRGRLHGRIYVVRHQKRRGRCLPASSRWQAIPCGKAVPVTTEVEQHQVVLGDSTYEVIEGSQYSYTRRVGVLQNGHVVPVESAAVGVCEEFGESVHVACRRPQRFDRHPGDLRVVGDANQ